MRSRLVIPLVLLLSAASSTGVVADQGNSSVTMSFFSGGGGAHADWFVTSDQPPGDTDKQAIRLQTTFNGYAGILFHHVTGIPAADFPDSSFWNKTPDPYTFEPSTLGSPRLVVAFQNAAGVYDGYADLRQNTRFNDWEQVSDVGNYPNSGWDVMNKPGPPCPFVYNATWPQVQACFAGDTTLAVYLTTDSYNIYHLIDDITVNGKTFSSGSDNGGGNNYPAGPTATTDPSLLPPLFLLQAP
jgi:hypothetical protein